MAKLHGAEARQYRTHRFLMTLYAGPPDPLEWLLGTLKCVFGAWLLMPFSTFATAPHLYRYISQFPEKGWGVLFLALGVLQWMGWHYAHNKLRFWVGIAAASLWDIYGYQMWRADHRSTALAFLSVIAAGQLLAVVWLYPHAFSRFRHDRN